MKKLIILSLIITSLFVISCKNSSDSSSSSSTTTTNTPLQGTWANTTDGQTYVFNGTAIAVTQTGLPNLSTGASDVSMTVAGTFRLDGSNLYTTFKTATATVSDGSTTVTMTDLTEVTDAAGGSLPVQVDNTEHLFGTYAVNGNTLTLTPTGNSAQNFTKQ